MITKRNWLRRADLAFFERGVQLLKAGVYDIFDEGDYVTELADSPPEFWINLDHQLRAEISPNWSQYFS